MKEREEGGTRVPSCRSHLQGTGPTGRDSSSPILTAKGHQEAGKSPEPWDGSAPGSSPVLQTHDHPHSWAPTKWKCLPMTPKPQGMSTVPGHPPSAVHPPQQGADSLSLVSFPASFFLLQGGREHGKRLGEAPKWQLQEGIAVSVAGGCSVQAGQAQSLPCLA